MRFMAVDDEPYALLDLKKAIRQVSPEAQVEGFSTGARALEYAREHPVDVAFLDIELGAMNGILLAKKLKELQPGIHIVFVTSYESYAVDAFSIHATGYLLKPVKEEEIRRELTFIDSSDRRPEKKRIRVQTFGGFEVFADGQPLHFKRAKAKGLLAYLVDCRGASVTTRMACSVLWEDDRYDRERKNYFHTVLAELKTVLKEAGAEDILRKSHNSISIDADRLDCDSYRFLEGDSRAVNSYRGDYMPCYSWAEFSVGMFEGNRL